MNNPFDDKIRQSLENFEMPFDATAWAELEKQLPIDAPFVSNSSSSFGLKVAAGIALVAVTAVAVWYFNADEELAQTQEVTIETTVSTNENVAEVEIERTSKAPTQSGAKEKSDEDLIQDIAKVSNTTKFNEPQTTVEVPQQATPQTSTTKEISQEESISESKAPVESEKQDISAPLLAKFVPSAIRVCVGEDVVFINESSDMKAVMAWDFGDGSSSSELNPVYSYVLPGKYTAILNADNGKTQSQQSVSIVVNPVPTLIFTGEQKLNGYEAIPLYVFATATQPTETAVWSFSDGAKISGNKAEHLFREAGTSVAKLTVTNSYGCVSVTESKYETAEFNLLAPDAFSPNGDGINEVFIPKALPEMGVAFEMTIQNPRTGEIVYRTENASFPWNGTLNNAGQKLDHGLYVWTVVLKDNVVENRVFNGKIQLQR